MTWHLQADCTSALPSPADLLQDTAGSPKQLQWQLPCATLAHPSSASSLCPLPVPLAYASCNHGSFRPALAVKLVSGREILQGGAPKLLQVACCAALPAAPLLCGSRGGSGQRGLWRCVARANCILSPGINSQGRGTEVGHQRHTRSWVVLLGEYLTNTPSCRCDSTARRGEALPSPSQHRSGDVLFS